MKDFSLDCSHCGTGMEFSGLIGEDDEYKCDACGGTNIVEIDMEDPQYDEDDEDGTGHAIGEASFMSCDKEGCEFCKKGDELP